MAEKKEDLVELTTFSCNECYVYVPIPPAATFGHRAELWNPEKWTREVKLRVVTTGDEMKVKLEDKETGKR